MRPDRSEAGLEAKYCKLATVGLTDEMLK